jgi:hypothetical protein
MHQSAVRAGHTLSPTRYVDGRAFDAPVPWTFEIAERAAFGPALPSKTSERRAAATISLTVTRSCALGLSLRQRLRIPRAFFLPRADSCCAIVCGPMYWLRIFVALRPSARALSSTRAFHARSNSSGAAAFGDPFATLEVPDLAAGFWAVFSGLEGGGAALVFGFGAPLEASGLGAFFSVFSGLGGGGGCFGSAAMRDEERPIYVYLRGLVTIAGNKRRITVGASVRPSKIQGGGQGNHIRRPRRPFAQGWMAFYQKAELSMECSIFKLNVHSLVIGTWMATFSASVVEARPERHTPSICG